MNFYAKTNYHVLGNLVMLLYYELHKNNWFVLYIRSCVVYLRAVGGEVGATSSLAPKIGPLGLVSCFFLNVFFANVQMYVCRVSMRTWRTFLALIHIAHKRKPK